MRTIGGAGSSTTAVTRFARDSASMRASCADLLVVATALVRAALDPT